MIAPERRSCTGGRRRNEWLLSLRDVGEIETMRRMGETAAGC
jgi:hypothetical protein